MERAGGARMPATSAPPIVLVQRLIAGRHADAEISGWLASGLSAWLNAGGSLPLLRCLGIPATVPKVRVAMRNLWLKEAAGFVAAPTSWAIARALSDECDHFERSTWPAWQRLDTPPRRATELQKRLFLALKTGVGLPGTPKQMANILEA